MQTLEQEIFSRKTVRFNDLIPFGFSKSLDTYHYSEPFMNGAFRAEITIDSDGTVTAKVIDQESDEEYLPIHLVTHTSSFVETVRANYMAILQKIANACFTKEPFLYPQTNRLTRLIQTKYGESPDFPFKSLTTAGIFRNPLNRKWYALVMPITEDKLATPHQNKTASSKRSKTSKKTLASQAPAPDAPIVEILNLKINPDDAARLLQIKGFYPPYHMNHKSWITVALNDTVPDEDIMALIDTSRNFTLTKTKRSTHTSSEPQHWLIPANPKYYDIEHAFDHETTLLWKQSSALHVGDIIYIYVAAPISAILYACRAIEVDIPYDYDGPDIHIKRVVKLTLLKRFDPASFTFATLNAFGIKAIRGPRLAPDPLVKALQK